MRRLKAVAVGADDAEILEAVIEAVAVDMIQLDGNSPISCALRPAADLARG